MRLPAGFFWYELMTTDPDAAEAFYKAVVGWNAEPFPGNMPYTVVKAGDRGVGGIMQLPETAARMGMPPVWLGYLPAADIEASTKAVRDAGGQVHREPEMIPGVGSFSVVSDPQGAIFMLLQPTGDDMPPLEQNAIGNIGWHELYADDWQSAMDFYSGQFGWTRAEAMDMGPMGTYQLFSAGAEPIGGMMNRPDGVSTPAWQFYFVVDAIDAAARRISENGGQVVMGPMEVPGGSWILQGVDPQGARFALTAAKR